MSKRFMVSVRSSLRMEVPIGELTLFQMSFVEMHQQMIDHKASLHSRIQKIYLPIPTPSISHKPSKRRLLVEPLYQARNCSSFCSYMWRVLHISYIKCIISNLCNSRLKGSTFGILVLIDVSSGSWCDRNLLFWACTPNLGAAACGSSSSAQIEICLPLSFITSH